MKKIYLLLVALVSTVALSHPKCAEDIIVTATAATKNNINCNLHFTGDFDSTVSSSDPDGIAVGNSEYYSSPIEPATVQCVAPDAPTAVTFSTTTATNTTVTATAAATATAITGYLVVRSTAATLTAEPVALTVYTPGTMLGGGTVVAFGLTANIVTDALASNTRYYYFIYAYNYDATNCPGPIYSATAATANVTTCIATPEIIGISNLTVGTATLNWTSSLGGGANPVSYKYETFTDAALTVPYLGASIITTTSKNIGALTRNKTFYYRLTVVATTGCDATPLTGSFYTQNDVTPINLTVAGFNADVIANGVGLAGTSTTGSIDGGNFAYLSRDYKPNPTTTTNFGLPTNRLLNSPVAGLNFILQDYAANNALRLAAQNASGILTLATPIRLNTLYIAGTSGGGEATISAKVNFSDGTSQDPTTLITLINGDSDPSIAVPALTYGINLGRVDRLSSTGIATAGNFKVFQATVPILPANQSKMVASVLITKTSAGATEPVANIFAISGKVTSECPVLNTSSVTAVTSTDATINWTLISGGQSGQVSYTIEVTTDAAFTVHAVGSPFTLVTSLSKVITGLTGATQYYYRIKAANLLCQSPTITGTFTTICTAPATPVASAQEVCAGSTVASLTTTNPITNAVIKWYTAQDGGTALAATDVLIEGTYYVSQTVNACESNRLAVIVTLKATPAAPLAAATQSYCEGATVGSLVATGTSLAWSTTPTGMPLATTTPLIAGTYYVTQTTASCTSPATAVDVTLNPIPSAPATAATKVVCEGATVADLTVTGVSGATISWSATEGGSPLATTTPLSAGTYFVTQTLNTCTSTPATVDVTINPIPAAPTATNTTICAGTTVSELTVSGVADATFTWYMSLADAPLDASTVVTAGTYYVTQTVATCTSAAATVAISINEIPAIPQGDATQSFIDGATIASLTIIPATGTTVKWYTMSESLYIEVPTTTLLVDGTTYYANQSIGTCASNYLAITVKKVLNTGSFIFSNLSVYPNPIADHLNVTNTAPITRVLVTNLLGQTVIDRKTYSATVQLNTSGLQAGTYILQVYSDNDNAVVKLIKK